MNEELKKCPFCGKVPEIELTEDSEGFGEFWIEHFCQLKDIGIEIDILIHDDNKRTLIEAWNTRYVEGKE